ncbi:Cytochrome b-c1 complex subunit 7 [Heracleum sosnowskyi]|uniref:Cytochrome b-c1 complex subunit 7 n=1 Tax=Heracleum sosnowskyi TaxID=360622 RepID=A0AAD8HNN6_9APIA|nr:Cytochrome b-c1 complex subunit 7 [Heracleum sosnowskyi]
MMKWLGNPVKNPLARIHKAAVDLRIRKLGLRYDDLYDPLFSLDVKEALDRLPDEVVQARNQRLKRCMDLSMKHSYLSKEMQAMQTPFRTYIQEMMVVVLREKAERKALNALPLYQRTIP